MNINFDNKIVLITGASSGIGRATAKQFAESGACVIIHYNKNRETAEQTLQELSGNTHMIVQADLSDPASICQMTEEIINKKGAIHILVNNAGVFTSHPITDSTYEKWQEAWKNTINVNLIGPANLTFCVVQHMLTNGGGKIINVSSRGAFRGEPNSPAYPPRLGSGRCNAHPGPYPGRRLPWLSEGRRLPDEPRKRPAAASPTP